MAAFGCSLREHIAQKASLLHGVDQMECVKEFLQNNPRFLLDRSDISEDLGKFSKVHYVLIPRDYFVWVDPQEVIPVIDFDPFLRMLTQNKSLAKGMEDLLTFEWLPVEGRDFTGRYETFAVNGVSVEGEVLYASY